LPQEYTLGLGEIRKIYRKAVKAVGTTLSRPVMLYMQGSYNGDEEQQQVRISHARGVRAINFDHGDGIEYRTDAITDLALLESTFNHMEELGWSYQQEGFTRVLVKIDDDHTAFEKLKLWWFCKQIEPIIFALVNGHRKNAGNAKELPPYTRYFFKAIQIEEHNGLSVVVSRMNSLRDSPFRISDYSNWVWRTETGVYWCNPFATVGNNRYVAFNLFHSCRNVREAQIFALIAHNMVVKVKEMTVAELEEALALIYSDGNAEQTVARFLSGLGIPPIPTRSRARVEDLTSFVVTKQQQLQEQNARYQRNAFNVAMVCAAINAQIAQAQGVR